MARWMAFAIGMVVGGMVGFAAAAVLACCAWDEGEGD